MSFLKEVILVWRRILSDLRRSISSRIWERFLVETVLVKEERVTEVWRVKEERVE